MHKGLDSELSTAQEMYLKTIYLEEREKPVARPKGLAAKLDVSKASVSGALKTLAAKGLVEHDPYSYVTLTDKGRSLAEEIMWRYLVLRRYMQEELGLSLELAEANACRMEHVVDDEVIACMEQKLN